MTTLIGKALSLLLVPVSGLVARFVYGWEEEDERQC
jgi:hypothetical protein